MLEGNGGKAGVTVIAHNTSAATLAGTLPPSLSRSVHWLELNDSVPSPAGPYNYGLERTDATWVSFLGSDDYLQAGAVRDWLRLSPGADAVLTRLKRERAGTVRTPPLRPFPRKNLHAVRDRLYYRSAPLGLVKMQGLRRLGLAWEAGMPSGGDLKLSALLYTRGIVRVQRRGPGYVIGEDASDRVTMRDVPLEVQLAHLDAAWGPGGWALDLPEENRSALATKYLRIHVFGAAYYRALNGTWQDGDRELLAGAVRQILTFHPGAATPLSRADRALLDLLLDTDSPQEAVDQASLARRKFLSSRALLPRDLRNLLDREAPWRFSAASALAGITLPGGDR